MANQRNKLTAQRVVLQAPGSGGRDQQEPGAHPPGVSVRTAAIAWQVIERWNEEVRTGRRVPCPTCGDHELVTDMDVHRCPGLEVCVDCGCPGELFVADPDLYAIDDYGDRAGISQFMTGGVAMCQSCLHARLAGLQRAARPA